MPETYHQPAPGLPAKSSLKIWILVAACIAAIIAVWIFEYSQPSQDFRPQTLVHVGRNMSLSSIANELAAEHVIRSSFLFRMILVISDERQSVGAGDYLFNAAPSLWQTAYRLSHNEEGLSQVRVTFPEGITVRDMGNILAGAIGSSSTFTFDEKGFLAEASTSEGYLFPDTYFFMPNDTPAAVIGILKNTFDQKLATLSSLIVPFQASTTLKSYPRTLVNIVTMASILEKEATSTADRRIIAGILWKRLDAGQLLEVDAPFLYILGKTSAELTLKDLATSSPYNTYTHAGLPPTPIGNPGLDALTDAVTPTATGYWYYVSDKSGAIHYAATYAQHQANRAKYVK